MLRFRRYVSLRPYTLRVPKESPMFSLNNNQRQAIIDEIRELFVHFNDGNPANDFIENLWQNMTPDKLYMALGNFTRMAENEE